MAKMSYPEDWDSRDIHWFNDQFECVRCDIIYYIDDQHEDCDGNDVCVGCLNELEEL